MASKSLARPLASLNGVLGLKRTFATVPRTTHLLVKNDAARRCAVRIPRQRVQQSFQRRAYAAEVPSPETQRVVKKKGFRFLRWTWRLTYLSALGGLVFVGYQIYQGRTPAEQVDPDPTKKTLVVLGMLCINRVDSTCSFSRG
jgi:NADH:ubiquinone reductase (non-electrogenic)